MHKNEFVRQIAKVTALPQKDVNQVIKSTIELIASTLREGDKVVLTGFGTFEIRSRRERRGVNPQTKERIVIPSTTTPGFTASNSLKLAVLGKAAPSSLASEFEGGASSPSGGTRGKTRSKAARKPAAKAGHK